MEALPRVTLVLDRERCESRLKRLPFWLIKGLGGTDGCMVEGRAIGMCMIFSTSLRQAPLGSASVSQVGSRPTPSLGYHFVCGMLLGDQNLRFFI